MESSISWLLLVLVATGWLTADALIPPGYILQVKPYCGLSATASNGSIHIVTDLEIEARAECANGDVDFNNADSVNFHLAIRYPEANSKLNNTRANTGYCMLYERADSLFTVKVLVSWGETGSVIHTNEEQYQVTCTFSHKGIDETANKTIVEGLIAAKTIQSYHGNTNLTMTLAVTDVIGDTITSHIHIGRKIRLKGSIDSLVNGLHAVGCDAIGKNNNRRYAIIRAGCGDGIVFQKDAGFKTKDNVTWSPYFEAFTLPGNTAISFECNFTVCTLPCTANTCTSRVKRQTNEDEDELYIMMQSDPIAISPEQGPSGTVVHASSERGQQTSNDVRFWVAVGFITVLATTSLVLSVCALLNTSKRSDVQYKV
ncbi:vitelline envelope sperm lysin receptor-like [Gigantopelta aegis]|uniref:vitelline envelope sperm lysin receptor-like n=1 Tax=Gigantopelta aegis TaxID=1735272 RepID=UPI001B889A32|nr:vitelline envelope sperm lysin receptor-like [Gigantopelta aegis]